LFSTFYLEKYNIAVNASYNEDNTYDFFTNADYARLREKNAFSTAKKWRKVSRLLENYPICANRIW